MTLRPLLFLWPAGVSACLQKGQKSVLWTRGKETNKAFPTIPCIWYVIAFFSPKKIRKLSFGCKNTDSIPSNELLITGKEARTLSTLRQLMKMPREFPVRNGVLRQDSVMTRRYAKTGQCPGRACGMMNRSMWVETYLPHQHLPVPVEASAK